MKTSLSSAATLPEKAATWNELFSVRPKPMLVPKPVSIRARCGWSKDLPSIIGALPKPISRKPKERPMSGFMDASTLVLPLVKPNDMRE